MTQTGRRKPQQQRAQNTVNRLLDAAAAIIAEEGMAALTTNKVAARAHCNIASLYQYFPNKESVVNALIHRHEQQFARSLNDQLRELEGMALAPAARIVVGSAMAQLRESEDIMPMLLARLGASEQYPEARRMEQRFFEAMRRFLLLQRDRYELRDIDTSVQVIYTAVSALVIKHLTDPLPYLSDDELLDEAVRLMCAYFPPLDSD
jgi:AcrR family transcriptional regulator